MTALTLCCGFPLRSAGMKDSMRGLFLLAVLIITRGIYAGLRAFYRRAQAGDSRAVGLLTGPFGKLCLDFEFSRQATRARLSDRAVAEYSDDSLSGYGDERYDKGGERIEDQQRGLCLPLLQNLSGTVAEIGCGN
jgi:hypothetical protein